MKQIVLLAFSFLLLTGFAAAQGKLLLKSGEKGLFLEHKVAAKEGIYSIGRLYNVNAKELAAYNGLDIAKGLNIGQVLRIPLTATNFSQAAPTGTPVYYKVGEKEGLYRVSINSGKLPIETIKKINNLAGDNVAVGSLLVVGYLNIPGELPAVEEIPAGAPKVLNPDLPPPAKVVTPPAPVKEEPKPEPKPVVVKDEPKEVTEVKVVKPEPVIEQKPPVITQPVLTTPAGSGYFKDQFSKQSSNGRDMTLTSGIFKTSSGWQDAKYYLLIDGVTAGTVVRITNPSNNKSVYAKVLGAMEGVNPGKGGPDTRISNAAAAALEIAETDKFVLRVNY